MTRPELPTPAELSEAPELATLAALEHAAELTVRALLAMHPELADHERPYWLDPPSPLPDRAAEIIDHIFALRDAVTRYRQANRSGLR